jgi:hypothetical protein
MKQLLIFLIMLTFSLPGLAQRGNNLFEQLTEKYAENDGFSASQISNEMFDLYLKKRNIDEDSPVYEALKRLDNILVVSHSNFTGSRRIVGFYSGEELKSEKADKDESDEAKEIHSEIIKHYKTSGYSMLKTEKRMGEDVKVYLKKSQDKIIALALVTNSSISTNLVELRGDIDLKTVSELNKALNLRGLENLYKIDNSSQFGIYPSIGYSNDYYDRLEDMALRERERARERYTELSEEQLQKIEQQAQIQAQKQMEMAEKYRQMAEQYGRQPIFLTTPGDTNTVYYIDGKKVKSAEVKEILKKDEVEQISKTRDDKDGKTVIRINTKNKTK